MERINTKMRNSRGGTMFAETNSINSRKKFGYLLQHSDPNLSSTTNNNNNNNNNNNHHFHHNELDHVRHSTSTTPSPGSYYDPNQMSGEVSPYAMSPWNESSATTTPYAKSPWSRTSSVTPLHDNFPPTGLIGSLVREEGHIYSLVASGELLYTGSDSKNIRVWKNQKEFSGFKSNSGLVKAIVISGEKIFTGHQDGKIRIWKVSSKDPKIHKKIGTLPTLKAYVKSSINPNNYVEVRRHRNALWIRHFDAISCLSLNEDQGILYSGSWDKTLKVWRISDSKCLESINAHDDAVNSVVNGFDGMVFTGSADGTVKVWRRELQGKGTKHFLAQTLLKQDSAVTALALNKLSSVIYAGSSDGIVNFWEREKHFSDVGVLKGHKLAVLCLATCGNLVFSGSADKTICVWRRYDDGIHTCLSVLTGHSGPVKCLAVEEDRESTAVDQRWIVYSGSLDKSVKVWKVSEQAPDIHQMAAQQERHIIGGFPSSRHSTPSMTPSFSSRKPSLSYR